MKICPQCGTEYELDQRFCPKDGSTLKTQGGETDMVGAVVADRYYVQKKLGEGGMGQVYLAEHVKMGRKSALKVMHPRMVQDADAIARFNREASNASRINHPNVAAIYDFGETPEGVIYLAMEFVEGEPLTAIIERQGALPPMRAAEIVRQTAEALNVAHDMGIVHRDLKPDNIMIARSRDGGDVVKVVDFGIAKAADSEGQNVTKTGLIVGTPEYMSPEQIAGDKLDGRSDLYSLALVAFNMLTGKLPFPAASAQESLIMRLTEQPHTLAQARPDVSWPAALQAVMDRALVRDAAHRHQRTTEFARELVRAVEQMPDTAIAEGGTQVLSTDAIPATRVASAPAAPFGGATLAQPAAGPAPAPAAAAPVDPAAMRAPVPKSKVPLVGAMAGSLAVVAVAGYLWIGKGAAATTDSTGATGAPATAAAVPYSQPGANGPAVLDSATFNAELNRLSALTGQDGNEKTADEALPQLASLRSKVKGWDVARVDAARAEAYILKNDGPTACSIVSPIRIDTVADTTGRALARRIGILKQVSCP